MAQVINTNILSLNAQRNLTTSQASLATAVQRLSSGLRINSAKDDAAGLAISERFTTQIRGLNQAVRNANDGISLAQTAEGAMASITNNLQRIRELAVQSRNATNSETDRKALQAEVLQLKEEIDRVATQTTFNGVRLLDGTFNAQVFQVGADQGQTITIASIANAKIADLGSWTSVDTPATTTGAALVTPAGTTTPGAFTLAAADLAAPTTITGTAPDPDTFAYAASTVTIGTTTINVAAVTAQTSEAEARQGFLNNLKSAIDAADITGLSIDSTTTPGSLAFSNTTGSPIVIQDTSSPLPNNITVPAQTTSGGGFTALTGSNFTINNTNIVVGTAANTSARLNDLVTAINRDVTGVTASIVDGNKLKLTSSSPIVVGGDSAATVLAQTGLTADTYNVVAGSAQTGFTSLTIATPEDADNAILAMDAALSAISSSRADLGAIQNRFMSTIENLQITAENLTASRSRIMDADFAAETAALSRAQILQQAGTAMVAQANQVPQGVLQLLQR